jgi:hypothetical protein
MKNPCDVCRGGGVLNVGGTPVKCPVCEGTGKQYDPGLDYSYSLDVVALGAGLTTQAIIQIVDKDFRWIYAIAQSTGDFLSTILDGGRQGRQFQNIPVHRDSFWGTAQNPMLLLTPYRFLKQTPLSLVLTDVSGAPNTIHLTFRGAQVDPDPDSSVIAKPGD